jgi:hypothetical protein
MLRRRFFLPIMIGVLGGMEKKILLPGVGSSLNSGEFMGAFVPQKCYRVLSPA